MAPPTLLCVQTECWRSPGRGLVWWLVLCVLMPVFQYHGLVFAINYVRHLDREPGTCDKYKKEITIQPPAAGQNVQANVTLVHNRLCALIEEEDADSDWESPFELVSSDDERTVYGLKQNAPDDPRLLSLSLRGRMRDEDGRRIGRPPWKSEDDYVRIYVHIGKYVKYRPKVECVEVSHTMSRCFITNLKELAGMTYTEDDRFHIEWTRSHETQPEGTPGMQQEENCFLAELYNYQYKDRPDAGPCSGIDVGNQYALAGIRIVAHFFHDHDDGQEEEVVLGPYRDFDPRPPQVSSPCE